MTPLIKVNIKKKNLPPLSHLYSFVVIIFHCIKIFVSIIRHQDKFVHLYWQMPH